LPGEYGAYVLVINDLVPKSRTLFDLGRLNAKTFHVLSLAYHSGATPVTTLCSGVTHSYLSYTGCNASLDIALVYGKQRRHEYLSPIIPSSHMSATPVPHSTIVNTNTHNPNTGTNEFDDETPRAIHEDTGLFLPLPKPTLLRQYSSLHDHADQLQGVQTYARDRGAVQRHEGRRESFVWDVQPAHEDMHRHSRNPMMMQQPVVGTPPPLHELLHRPRNEDADDTHNANLLRVESRRNSSASEHPSGLLSEHSTASSLETSQSSVAGISRAAARYVSDMGQFSSSRNDEKMSNLARGKELSDHVNYEATKPNRKERRLSFKLSSTESKDQTSITSLKHPSPQPIAKSSLRDRRNVNMELSLPDADGEVPVRNKSAIVHFNSITPSRPRSPQTPFTHSERPKWQQYASPNNGPIMEEDCMGHITTPKGNEEHGLIPDNDRFGSSDSPKLERSFPKVLDRSYMTSARFKRDRRGLSGTSESSMGRTANGSWTPEGGKVLPDQQLRTKAELQQLGQASKNGRAGRWRWARSTTRSSDEAGQAPVEKPTSRRFFKRSVGMSEQMDAGKQRKQSFSSPQGRLWWIGKQTLGSGNPKIPTIKANKTIPLPPTVISAPTPPQPDIHGEVKGKLADFFFDDHTGISVRKLKVIPGGHWDSDALLMSYLSTEKDDGDDTDDEGPMGPLTPILAPRGFTVDQNPGYGTSGTHKAPGSYLDVKGSHPGPVMEQDSVFPAEGEVRFRVKHDFISIGTPLPEQTPQEIAARKWFEWVVPEHLPNSPCCPIHPKYQGPHFGMCYWHGKKRVKGKGQSTAGVEWEGGEHDGGNQKKKVEDDGSGSQNQKIRSGTRDWETGKFEIIPEEPRRRRLASLSDEEKVFG
jgi:hypothetical protein